MPKNTRRFEGVKIGRHGDQPLRRIVFDEKALSMRKIGAIAGITPSNVGGYLRGHHVKRRDDIRIAASGLLGRQLTNDECWVTAPPLADDGIAAR